LSTAHFHRNPSGRSQLAVFLRCSLGPYDSDMGARSRLEKQPTDVRQNTCYFGGRTLGWSEAEPWVLNITLNKCEQRPSSGLTRIAYKPRKVEFTSFRLILGPISFRGAS